MSKNLERYSLYEAYEVRQVLETKAMDLIVRNATDSDLDEIETAYQTMLLRFAETNTTTGEFELHQLYAKKPAAFYGTDAEHRIVNNSRNDAHNFS